MKSTFLVLSLCAATAFAQQLPPPQTQQLPNGITMTQEVLPPKVKPDAVVATVNGKPVTAEQIQRIVKNSPPQIQRAYTQDPKEFMKQYAWYQILTERAEKEKLAEKMPYKDQLEFYRLFTLVNAELNEAYVNYDVLPDAQRKHYNANTEKYREVRAKLIYVPFSNTLMSQTDAKGKKLLMETEARARAEQVVKEARGGADFVKLVKQYSEDPASAQKDGDLALGIRANTTAVPEPMRKAILALKQDETSDPLRHENGFYIFHAEKAGVLPYEQVKDEVFKELKEEGFKEWQKKSQAQSSFKVENEDFFKSPTMALVP